jgi:flagellar motility protein MotE (MotC chaperone)
MKPKTQIMLTALITVKIFIGLVFIFQFENISIFSGSSAIASELPNKTGDKSNIALNSADTEKVDLNFVVQKMELLKKRELELEKRKAELISFQEEIDKKIQDLSKLRNEIKSQMTNKETIGKKKIKHLIKVYSSMKPQSAAGLIEKQSKTFAVEMLSQMKGEKVGEILTYVEKGRAALLIEMLAKRK